LYFTGFNSTTKSYAPELETQALLTMTSPSSYTLTLSNGASQVFSMSDGSAGASRRIFLTQVLDPAGNSVQLNYDGQLRITNIVDAIGQATTLLYTNTAYPDAITSVEDPFGRTAYLQYTSAGLLSQITDVLGITSQYTYETNDFVSALQTPYGISTFFTGQTNGTTWLTATDPLGGTELLEFNQTYEPSSDSPVTVPRGMGALDTYLNFRNSFYWDKVAYQQGAGDFTKAVIYHFCHDAANQSLESDIPESIKKPLENRVWFNYPGQTLSIVNGTISRPSAIGRVLDDGTSPVTYYQYNSLGNVTNMIDPVGRNFSYIYSTNNVDLLQTVMTHNGKYEIQKTVTYNSQHLPLTITDAAGQTTNFTYNASGQILAITDPKGETTSFSYDPNGYVLTMTGPLQTTNDVASFTHDGYGRLQTMTDTEGYTVTFNYDAADRVTQTTHPDGTSEQFVYSNLDRVASCDRLGRWTTNTYNALQQLTRTQDPLGRVTQLEWCRCGAITALTDPLGHTTTWEYDVESRPIAKHFADGSTVSWVYENTTSRLAATWDEKGQQKAFRYYPDNNLLQVSYPNAIVTTPTVTFTYDPDYNRIITMQDGIGTSTYAYIPITTTPALGAGLLASVTGPLPNSTVTYQYDQLGRVVKQAINGVTQTTAYDSLGRPTKVGNALGAFQYSYVDATPRLASATYPNGQTSLYAYYNTLGDERLQQIQNLYPNGSPLSSFGYAYNAVGQITAWTNLWDTVPMRVWQPAYDAVDELTNVASTGGVSPITSYTYAYDPAANRLLAATNGGQMTSSYNILNQFISSSIPSNNVTYEWDGENRLTAINQGSNREEFSYDGMSRRVGVTEMANGVTISNFFYLWCETNICEVRDSTGANVTKRLFDQGEQAVGTGAQPAAASYYYTRDHLGSVRESVDATGTLASRFDYDPYGQQTVLQQNFKPEFGYAGYVADSASGLYFTRHRALDSSLGRWLSRDPHHGAELLPEGPNLYAYVGNSPITRMDPTGLDCPNHRDWWNWKGQFDDYMAWVMQQLTDALTKANNATQIKGG
jgi:RHS repeat-associated protein